MILRQGFFSHGADFLALAEVFVGPVPQILFGFPVAGLAGGGDLGERAHDLVIRVLDAALSLVGHRAVGAGHAVLTVGALQEHAPAGMLGLEDGGLAELVDVVGEALFVVVLFDGFNSLALVKGEGQIIGALLEIVFFVALGAHERAHFLLGGVVDVLALALEGLDESGSGDAQVHGLGVMAVGAADGVHDFIAEFAPLLGVEFGDAVFSHVARDIGLLQVQQVPGCISPLPSMGAPVRRVRRMSSMACMWPRGLV